MMVARAHIPDPAVTADGRCAQCGRPRKPERSETYGKDSAQRDPFCSRECVEKWHGIQDGKGVGSEDEDGSDG